LSKFQQRDLKSSELQLRKFVFLRPENALADNGLLLGERCGTASSVRSAKIKFLREKQAQSQQNQAMALSKC
jgi:hypothetical protein